MILATFFTTLALFVAVPGLTGLHIEDMGNISANMTPAQRDATLILQGLFSFGVFVGVPLLFAYATHPRPGFYLGLRPPGHWLQPLLAVLIMLGLLPLESQLAHWISLLPWSPSIRASEAATQELMNQFTKVSSLQDALVLLLIVAVLPGLGEELLCRGLFMRFIAKKLPNMWLASSLAAVLFALAHTSVFNFLPIMMAGLVLGIIYFRTGSLYMSMLGHAASNGVQIILQYFACPGNDINKLLERNEVPPLLLAISALVVVGSFLALWRVSTPLPASWTEDYTAAELEAGGDG